MRICLVGGIFGKPPAYRERITTTPETVLAAGLAERGHEVVTRGHHGPFDYRGMDVVHVHHLSYGALAAAAQRPPFAFTNHRFSQPDALRRAAMRLVIARAEASVVLSEAERAAQARTAPRARARPVIPNGVDAGVFAFVPPPPVGAVLELLFVGQLVALKNVDVLLAALARARTEARLRLVYQVADEEPRLRALAGELGVTAEFLGARRPEEVAALLAASHALVLPSLTEALPSAVTEALLVGRPVVGSAVGAIPEQTGDFGRLVAPGDATALAAAVDAVADDYPALAARAQAARTAAAARYSVAAMVDAHERLYEEIRARR